MSSPRPVVRLTTLAELVASLPIAVGFVPSESLVVQCCYEPRGRTGLCLRFDLPLAADSPALLAEVIERVKLAKATRVVVAVYTEEADDGGHPRADLIAGLEGGLGDVVLTEAVLIRGDRFWSYTCSRSGCCPPEGTPVLVGADSPAISLIQVESVLSGRAVLPDRRAVEQSLAAPVLLAAVAARQRCEWCEDLLTSALIDDVVEARAESLSAWNDVLTRFRTPPATLGDLEVAALAVSLLDVAVRDGVAALWPRNSEALPQVLMEVCRRTPAPYDAPACTVLAWLTYAGGGGALVTVALTRALSTDPDYSMARLLAEALSRQVPPGEVRRALRATGKRQKRR